MPEIQTIGINYIGINSIPLPNINFSVPQTPPVTLSIGSPIIDVPGCVKYNPANKNSIELVNQDERGSRVMCDGSVPWFEPMDYQPENLVYVQEQSVAGGVSGSVSESSELTAKQIACIKAEGSGEATGKLAAASITAPITPTLTEIPYVGWLVAGFFNMFGQKQGAEIGGQMARDFKDC